MIAQLVKLLADAAIVDRSRIRRIGDDEVLRLQHDAAAEAVDRQLDELDRAVLVRDSVSKHL